MLTDLFLATSTELHAHYPNRRAPLETPVRTKRKSPFAGTEVEVLVWDPAPGAAVGGERVGPPSPSLDVKGLTKTSFFWLVRSVLGDRTPSTLERQALFGSDEGPWIYEIPSTFVTELAALDDAGRARLAQTWNAHEREEAMGIRSASTRDRMLQRDEAYWRGYLDVIARAAKEALAQGRNLYLWMSL